MNRYYSVENKNLLIEFNVQCNSWPDLSDLCMKVSYEVFKILDLYNYAKKIEFLIILTDNKSIQLINKKYRNKSSPTNTLSFPAQDIIKGNLHKLEIQDGFLILGDVIFAYETIKDESDRDSKLFEDHFSHLLIHGLLHLLGYDHQTDEEALEMEILEVEILEEFSIKSPYK